MSDSTRRVLFGNLNINLKINVHATLQFSDKSNDNIKKVESQTQNLSLHKSGNSIDKITHSPKNSSGKFNKNFINSLNNNTSNSGLNDKSPKYNKIKRPITSINNNKKMRNISASPQQRKMNQKSGIKKNNVKDLSADKNKILEKLEMPEEDLKDNSFINIEVEREDKKVDKDFTEFINIFKENYPLSKLDSFNDLNEMINYTKNIASQLISYQKMYYERAKKNLNRNQKLKYYLIKYNELYRNMKKKNNRLNEKLDNFEIENYISVNINKKECDDLKEKNIPLKNYEIDLFKEIFGLTYDKVDIEPKNIEDNKNENEEDKNLLLKSLKEVTNKFGSLNNLLNEKNSTEEERRKANEIINKYNLKTTENENELKEKKIENKTFENIITNKPDENDNKLEQYLTYFYSKKNIPKIPFKKTSANNYEYGTLKVMIKIEGETFRVRYLGKYSLLDNFLESNAPIEIKKKKNPNSSKKKPK